MRSRNSQQGGILADIIIWLVLLTVSAGAAVVGLGIITHGPENSSTATSRPWLISLPQMLHIGASREPLSILLVGADDREDRGRADSVMVAWINPKNHRAALLSIQRDTRVDIPGHKSDKINHAYRFGGVPLLKQTVEGLLGEEIKYYAKLDFETFKQVVDTLGGVTVTVEDVEGHGRGMNYDDNAGKLHVHLKPGTRKLNGKEAIGYVRYRSDSDIERARRQREFIKTATQQHLKGAKLPTVVKATRLILKHMDSNLGTSRAISVASAIRKIPPEGLMTVMLPITPERRHGVSYSKIDGVEAEKLLTRIKEFMSVPPKGFDLKALLPKQKGMSQPQQRSLKQCRVAVLNGSGIAGTARRVADKLQATGCIIVAVANSTDFNHQLTTITCGADAQEAARELGQVINGITDIETVSDALFVDSQQADILVTVGRDIAGQ